MCVYLIVRLSVCLSVCLFVCLPTGMSQKPHVQISPNFLCVLLVAVIRSAPEDTAIMLCTSGFLDDVMFSFNGANGPKTLCFVEFARWRYRLRIAVYDFSLICSLYHTEM